MPAPVSPETRSAPGSPPALSLRLLQWLKADAAWRLLPARTRARLVWSASLGSVNLRLSRLVAAQEAAPAVADPILIVGPWRSGTTVMHQLLAAASGLPTPRTWQCMNACAFALAGRPPVSREIMRPMDALTITTDSPQEDEFALLSCGVDTSYRAFLMPHRIAELHSTLDQAHWLANTTWLDDLEAFMRATLLSDPAGPRTGEPGRPMLLKSPNHTFRLQAFSRRFPAMRLVWLLRDAEEVFLSNRRMWKSMFERHGLTRADHGALDDFLAAALDASADAIQSCLDGELAGASWRAVDMSSLRRDPRQTTRETWTALSLGDGGAHLDEHALEAACVALASGEGAQRRLPEDAIPQRARAAIGRLDAAQASARHRQALA